MPAESPRINKPSVLHRDFSTDKPDYDEFKFYPHLNKRDSASTVTVKINDKYLQQISAMVQSGKFPIVTTQSDLIRNFIVHGLHFLAEHHEEFADGIYLAHRQLMAAERQAEIEMADSYISMMTEQLELSRDFPGETEKLLDEAYGYAALLHSPALSRKVLEALKRFDKG